METNYAQLMTRAQAVLDKADNRLEHRIFRTTHFLEAAAVVHELAQALTVVCTQNRNLRQDLAQVQRDYEANLNELLKEEKKMNEPQAIRDPENANHIWVETAATNREIFDLNRQNTYVGFYDPWLPEVLE